ncbi:MAG: AMP-binding protein [Steroidobacteraceae bacterium]
MSANGEAFHPPWFDPAMPGRDDCVLKYMLDVRAARHPDRRVAVFEDGVSWTYRECRAHVRAMAAGLQALGVAKGDRVVAWLPNGRAMITAWFAINYLGAIFVPLNTAYRGRMLEHVVNLAGAKLLLAHDELVERLMGLALTRVERVVAIGPAPLAAAPPFALESAAVLAGSETSLDDSAQIEPWDIQSIIYTSGTTGPSKGVLSPYLQLYTTALVCYGYLRDGETMLVNLPLFHVGGTSAVYSALLRSGSIFVVDGFDTHKFWTQVRQGDCASTSGLIGVMAAFLANASPRADDRDSPLRWITMFPISRETVAFAERFGFDYITGFNMTEASAPLVSDVNSRVYGCCGRPRSGVVCRIVDEHDIEVPVGTAGELIVRSDLPWTMNAGYDGMPEATAAAWRNGWFHTDDAFRRDADGNYFFVDRIKDAIRRRGENISSLEIEAAVREHPAVEDVVAVGVPGRHGEEDVLIAVVAKSGAQLDPRALTEFLVSRVAYFMVPRYVRLVEAIPRTETNKLRKVVFREAGITPDTWDREAAGIHLKRERLGS